MKKIIKINLNKIIFVSLESFEIKLKSVKFQRRRHNLPEVGHIIQSVNTFMAQFWLNTARQEKVWKLLSSCAHFYNIFYAWNLMPYKPFLLLYQPTKAVNYVTVSFYKNVAFPVLTCTTFSSIPLFSLFFVRLIFINAVTRCYVRQIRVSSIE